eukprot:SAG11_NODE_825_length_6992_cov_2.298564_9_plen_362_part_00
MHRPGGFTALQGSQRRRTQPADSQTPGDGGGGGGGGDSEEEKEEVVEEEDYGLSSVLMTTSQYGEVRTVALQGGGSVALPQLNRWISGMLLARGDDLYRYKGLLDVEGSEHKYVFQGVHMLFTGTRGQRWSVGERRTNRMVFIGRSLDAQRITSAQRMKTNSHQTCTSMCFKSVRPSVRSRKFSGSTTLKGRRAVRSSCASARPFDRTVLRRPAVQIERPIDQLLVRRYGQRLGSVSAVPEPLGLDLERGLAKFSTDRSTKFSTLRLGRAGLSSIVHSTRVYYADLGPLCARLRTIAATLGLLILVSAPLVPMASLIPPICCGCPALALGFALLAVRNPIGLLPRDMPCRARACPTWPCPT